MTQTAKHTPDWQLRALKAESLNAELLAALKAILEGRPIKEPPKFATVAHRNWELFEQARATIAKAEGR